MEIDGFFSLIDKLIGTPLYLLICAIFMVLFVYYFLKVLPARNKAIESLIKDNAKQTGEIAKITAQYEKSLDNSNKVIENNTAALKSTQAMLELLNSKVDENILLEKDLARKIDDYEDKITDIHIELATIGGKIK